MIITQSAPGYFRNVAAHFSLDSLHFMKPVMVIGILSMVLWLAFFLRFEGVIPGEVAEHSLYVWLMAVPLQYALCVLLEATTCIWRFFGLREAVRLVAVLGIAAVMLLAARIFLPFLHFGSQTAALPASVIFIDFAFSFISLAGLCGASRLYSQHAKQRHGVQSPKASARALLIGAGEVGWGVARELAANPLLGITPLGFVDDDPRKKGERVHGLPILGTTEDLPGLVRQYGANLLILTIARASGHLVRRLNELAQQIGVPLKTVPGISEIIEGKVNLSRIRSVSIDDLLRRKPVLFEDHEVRKNLCGATVMVTGAGGSIGSELCRQICRYNPEELLLVEQAENPLFNISRELQGLFPKVKLVPCIADICDHARMERLFVDCHPTVIFHAAAHKHVPMMEHNPGEAIKNNVLGTKNVADLAHRHGASEFVMISTDKAINPTSVMGVSKRMAEIYIQALSQRSQCRFVTVRFGNVLGSSGSVVPIFQEQIARGGPVTVTHPEMTRYFMTIPEASQLVLQAASLGQGGEIFILDMGNPVKIVDLARDLIHLAGLKLNEDIEIKFSGIRPGEKLFEELSISEERMDKTHHPRIFIGHYKLYPWNSIQEWIEKLRQSAGSKPQKIRETFHSIIPEYKPMVLAAQTVKSPNS
jgi:FlaA1/EpsC-like NDP-sugar epimerase